MPVNRGRPFKVQTFWDVRKDKSRLHKRDLTKYINRHTRGPLTDERREDLERNWIELQEELKGKPREEWEKIRDEYWRNMELSGLKEDIVAGYNRIWSVLEWLGRRLPKNAKIASIGCGSGYHEMLISERHPHYKIDAVDPSTNLLKMAREIRRESHDPKMRKRIIFREGFLENPRLPSNQYDFVMTSDAFHYTAEKWRQSLDKLIALLKRGKGPLLITYRPTTPGTNSPLRGRLVKELRQRGFTIIHTEFKKNLNLATVFAIKT